ncbi:hypothetical protein MKW98_009709 [Papaver atlanticum]|uniref:Uncharacterized protein n=1 Tax=Papaver atlanticum TaxID=357466 RepID=A0AAD4SXG8_9MAGN|nr:hypothetical protein MKW98_009709 [Papaver atlanticum]
MAKMSMFFGFFLFVLIVMPTPSSSTRMILEEDLVNKCPKFKKCLQIVCPKPIKVCPQIKCRFGSYTPCCGCPRCCASAN